MLRTTRKSKGFSCTIAVLAMLVMSALGATTASAQEDVTSAPPPLQWPTPVSSNSNGRIPFQYSAEDRKSTRLNSSHLGISYAAFCLKKKKKFTSDGTCSLD